MFVYYMYTIIMHRQYITHTHTRIYIHIYIKLSNLLAFQGCLSFHRSHIPGELSSTPASVLTTSTHYVWCPSPLLTPCAGTNNGRKAIHSEILQELPCDCPVVHECGGKDGGDDSCDTIRTVVITIDYFPS